MSVEAPKLKFEPVVPIYNLLPEQYEDYKIIDTYFGIRLQSVLKAHSLRPKKSLIL